MTQGPRANAIVIFCQLIAHVKVQKKTIFYISVYKITLILIHTRPSRIPLLEFRLLLWDSEYRFNGQPIKAQKHEEQILFS
jgi:hypothetical protein